MGFKVNSLVIAGNLTRDAEIYEGSGFKIATLNIAVNRSEKRGGEWVQVTDFQKAKSFVKDGVIPYLTKGKAVTLQGELQQEVWQDKETGKDKRNTIIFANTIQLDGGKSEQSRDGYSGQETPPMPQQYGEEAPF